MIRIVRPYATAFPLKLLVFSAFHESYSAGSNSFPPSKTSLRKFSLLFVTALDRYLRIKTEQICSIAPIWRYKPQKLENFPSIIAQILNNYQMMFSRTLFSKIIIRKANNSLSSSTTTALKLFSS